LKNVLVLSYDKSFWVVKTVFGSRSMRVLAAAIYLFAYISIIPLANIQKSGATGTVAFGSVSTGSTGSGQATSVTINKPSTTVSGDLLVAVIMIEAQNPTITLPGGGGGTWTNFPTTVKFTTGTSNTTIAAYYAVANGSEPASYTFSGGTNTQWVGAITDYKGVDTTTPIEAQSSTNSGTGGTTATALTVTPSTANARVVSVFGADQDAQVTFAPQAGIKERFDAGSTRPGVGNTDVSISAADISSFATTATGSKTATISATALEWGAFQYVLKPDGVVRMILFWDGTDTSNASISLPSGWSVLDDYDGMYVRGELPANFGQTFTSTTHTPTVSSLANSTASLVADSGNTVTGAVNSHTHGYAGTGVLNTGTSDGIGAASNSDEPANRTLQVIRYNAGVPNVIPNGAIALFDGSPGIPSGWANLSGTTDPFYHRMLKVGATPNTNGGSDTHTHSLVWPSLTASTGTLDRNTLFSSANRVAPDAHTHAAPSSPTATASATALPPYVQPLLAKANANTNTISIGITAMFDGDPGGGWVIRSKNSGASAEQIYYQKFLRPNDTFIETPAGAENHTHSAEVGTTGVASGSLTGTLLIPSGVARYQHTHNITANFNAVENMPPAYFNVVIAEKVNFILTNYYWYLNNGAIDPPSSASNKWGNPDIAQHVAIVTLPIAAADPPDLGRDLRLRLQILINGNNLAASTVTFKLQYNATRSASCITTNGSWVDIGASTATDKAWRYTTSTAVTSSDSTTLSGTFADFTGTYGASNVYEQYIRGVSPGTNPNGAVIGDRIEYDFHISDYAAAGATQYSFRIIENTGTLLSQYDFCPTLTTKPRTENQMRHGNFFDADPAGDGTGSLEEGFSWVD
jgi:hypothetical protein